MQDARENGYFDLSEIECAVMEVSGKVSFLPKSKYEPVNCNDMKIKTSPNGLIANLVIDGVIMENNLKAIGKDKDWLIKKLDKEGYKKIDDILLVICDNNEKLTVYPMHYHVGKSVLE